MLLKCCFFLFISANQFSQRPRHFAPNQNPQRMFNPRIRPDGILRPPQMGGDMSRPMPPRHLLRPPSSSGFLHAPVPGALPPGATRPIFNNGQQQMPLFFNRPPLLGLPGQPNQPGILGPPPNQLHHLQPMANSAKGVQKVPNNTGQKNVPQPMPVSSSNNTTSSSTTATTLPSLTTPSAATGSSVVSSSTTSDVSTVGTMFSSFMQMQLHKAPNTLRRKTIPTPTTIHLKSPLPPRKRKQCKD